MEANYSVIAGRYATTDCDIRRRRLASQYCLKVSSDVTNPARSCIFNKRFSRSFDKEPNQNFTRSILLVSVLAVICLRLVFYRKLFCSTQFLLVYPGFTLYLQWIFLYMHSENQTQVQRFLKVHFWNSLKTYKTIFTYNGWIQSHCCCCWSRRHIKLTYSKSSQHIYGRTGCSEPLTR